MTHNSLRAVLPSPIVRTVVVWGAQMKIVMQIAAALWLLQAASVLKAKRGFLSEYFNECVEEIEAPNRKPVYIELSSGLRSDDPKQRREMLKRARRAVISGGKGLGAAKRGRKVLEFDADTLKSCELIWRNTRDYRIEDDADEAMKAVNKRFTRQRARKLWGPRKQRK